MKNIEIFSGPGCSHCEAAKALLKHKQLAFKERDISAPGVMEEFRKRMPRLKSIPQIFIDGEHIGGLEDLRLKLG